MCVPKTLPLSGIHLLVLMLPWQTITWQFWSFMCYCSTAIQIWAKIHPLTTCCHFTSKVMSLKPKQISVLLSKSLRNTLIFTWQSACFALPLFFCSSVSTGESVCLWHICNWWCHPFIWIWPVYMYCSLSEAFWLSAFSTPFCSFSTLKSLWCT